MSNTYFEFKQFRIEQDQCAMKVTTDACIQGAWTPVAPQVKTVLDIGAGTGLLSLMLAQQNAGITIDAVEYDSAAAAQASVNASASPWHARLNIIEADVREYAFTAKYDLIITNPPFFINSLHNPDGSKTTARHNVSLSFQELLVVIINNLSAIGYASVLLPYAEYEIWAGLAAQSGLYPYRRLLVRHTARGAAKRVVGLFSVSIPDVVEEEILVIKGDDGAYTNHFNALLRPFYLYL